MANGGPQRNVLGGELIACSMDPVTGYYRTGCCENHGDDPGLHVVCCRLTAEFLEFEAANGNDLSTPAPQYGFPGLRPGDQWCVCAARWVEALVAGLRSRIANFKVPKQIFVVPELPRNAMGKVQKNLLRDEHRSLFETPTG